jgi:hypothetical protein
MFMPSIVNPPVAGESSLHGYGILPGVEALRLILLYLHLCGFAVLLGASVVQYLSGKLRINAAMIWGAAAQLITGLALSAPLRGGGDHEPSKVKLGVKLLIALAIFAMTFFSRKRETVNRGHFLAIIVLVLGNAAVAVFWR